MTSDPGKCAGIWEEEAPENSGTLHKDASWDRTRAPARAPWSQRCDGLRPPTRVTLWRAYSLATGE